MKCIAQHSLSCPTLMNTTTACVSPPHPTPSTFATQPTAFAGNTVAHCQPGSAVSSRPAQAEPPSVASSTVKGLHAAAGDAAGGDNTNTAAGAAAAAVLGTSGSPCSSSALPSCQGGAAAASQPPPQQQQEEVIQAIAAEVGRSGIVDAVVRRLQELVDSAAAVTHQLKRLKTLEVNPARMYSQNPASAFTRVTRQHLHLLIPFCSWWPTTMVPYHVYTSPPPPPPPHTHTLSVVCPLKRTFSAMLVVFCLVLASRCLHVVDTVREVLATAHKPNKPGTLPNSVCILE